jgi:hypothetical protein
MPQEVQGRVAGGIGWMQACEIQTVQFPLLAPLPKTLDTRWSEALRALIPQLEV